MVVYWYTDTDGHRRPHEIEKIEGGKYMAEASRMMGGQGRGILRDW